LSEEKSVLRVSFEQHPFWTIVALCAPFGFCFGIALREIQRHATADYLLQYVCVSQIFKSL